MSVDSVISNLHKAHQAGQEKYTYFLLAAPRATIGFAVQKTEGLALSWWLLLVALATVSGMLEITKTKRFRGEYGKDLGVLLLT
jgi:hypothetical protein